MINTLPEELKCIKLYQGAANAVTCDVVSMKNWHKGWFQVIHTGAADTDLTLSLYEATDVAAGTNAAVTVAQNVWCDLDMGTSSDTVAATTAGYSYTIDTGNYPNQMAFIEVDPSTLSAGYDCVYLADSGGNASNTCTILFWGVPRFAAAVLDTGITD